MGRTEGAAEAEAMGAGDGDVPEASGFGDGDDAEATGFGDGDGAAAMGFGDGDDTAAMGFGDGDDTAAMGFGDEAGAEAAGFAGGEGGALKAANLLRAASRASRISLNRFSGSGLLTETTVTRKPLPETTASLAPSKNWPPTLISKVVPRWPPAGNTYPI